MSFNDEVQKEIREFGVMFYEAREAYLAFKRKWDEGYKEYGIDYKGTKIYRDSLDLFDDKIEKIYKIVISAMQKVKKGDLSALPILFGYLDVKIRYYRSGYIKGEVCRVIKKVSLEEEHLEVLSGIILGNIGFAGREMNEIARLIPLVDNEAFRNEIYSLAEHGSKFIKDRIKWIVGVHLKGPLTPSVAVSK